jgi:hypothetical protein
MDKMELWHIFLLSTSASPANSHSTDCSALISHSIIGDILRFEVLTAVTMKNAVF